MKITSDMIIGDILKTYPDVASVFFEFGMHCLGCPSARGESIENACAVHGINADELVTALNRFLEK